MVPDSYVKARLIEAVACEGSIMEAWFACSKHDNKEAECAAAPGCSWTSWENATSLPLPTRKMLQVAAAAPAAPKVRARARALPRGLPPACTPRTAVGAVHERASSSAPLNRAHSHPRCERRPTRPRPAARAS